MLVPARLSLADAGQTCSFVIVFKLLGTVA